MSRCSACPGINTCVQPSGPENPDIIYIGEAPGKDENAKGIPFIGKTGAEVNQHYLPLAGQRRELCYFDNAISCLPDRPKGKLDKNEAADINLLHTCAAHHLHPYLRRVRPKLIVAMGAFACLALDSRIDLDIHHGIPQKTIWGTVFPMWHPAGGLHEPKKMMQIRTDWFRLKQYLNHGLYVAKDQWPNPDYREATDNDIEDIDPTMPMAGDTESSRKLGPYCLTYSQIPGQGRLIRASDINLLHQLRSKMQKWESIIYFHNWLYDKPVTLAMHPMGIFPDKFIRDTMLMAFHLGNVPQGLKALAYRELGMKMQDFDDLVIPYSRPRVIEYYDAARSQGWPKPKPFTILDEDGLPKLKKPHGMNTKLKMFFTYLVKDPEGKDVFGAWDNWEDSHEMIEGRLGPWPGKDIAHVPWEKMMHYACRDADATIRLAPVLDGMVEACEAGRPQEYWRDYGRD